MSKEKFTEIDSDLPLFTDKDREDTLLSYLGIIFRDKNKLIRVRLGENLTELKQNIFPYAFVQGVTTNQIRFFWKDSENIVPRPKLKKDKDKTPIAVAVRISRKFYNIVESDFFAQLPINRLPMFENPENYLLNYIQDLRHGKLSFKVDPEGLYSTRLLRKLVIKTYEMWRQIP